MLRELYAPWRAKARARQQRSRVAVGDRFYTARKVGLVASDARASPDSLR
jgi:hypothetical protein